jgi:hypothetical protein
MIGMSAYRAYFLSASDHIRDVCALQTADDAAACAEAQVMLLRSEYVAVEVYQERRLIGRTERTQQAA